MEPDVRTGAGGVVVVVGGRVVVATIGCSTSFTSAGTVVVVSETRTAGICFIVRGVGSVVLKALYAMKAIVATIKSNVIMKSP